MARLMALVFAVVLGAVIGASAHAGSPEINVDNPQKVAVHGFDIMSYWRDGEPKEGHTDISFDYRGAKWLFSSTDNRDAFAANPDKFAPKYGGYCAYAASRGYVANIDVNAWRIYKDRLYLNYSIGVGKRWAKEIDANIAKADENWPKPLEN